MSKFLENLVNERQKQWHELKAIYDDAANENRDLTADEQSTEVRINTALDEHDERIKTMKAREDRTREAEEARGSVPNSVPQERGEKPPADDALAFFRGESRARAFEVRGSRPFSNIAEQRTLTKGSPTAGGNTVQTSFYDQLVEHMIEVSGILQAGPTVLQTTSGETLQVPKTTAHSTATLITEGNTIGASDPTFGQASLGAYKYGFLIQPARELLDDTSVDLLGYLARESGRALGNAIGTAFITGTGTAQPAGIVTGSTLGVTGSTAVVGAFTADNLIDLYFSVIAPYRSSPSCGWLMRDATLANVRKLKDTTNQYLWQPSMQVGAPDTLLGKPVHTDPNVAAVALSAKSVLFGDVSRYFVRLVNGIRFERSDDYAFNTDLVTFRALVRADGILVDQTGAVKYFAGGAS